MINVTDIFTNNISFTQSVLKNSARNISDDSLQAILSFFKSSVNKHVKSSASTKPLSQQEIKDVDKFAKRAGVSALYLLPHKELFFKIDVKWFEDDVKTYLKAQHNLKVENPEVTFIYKYYLEDLYQAAYPLEATKPGFHGFPARFGQYCLFNEGYISDTVTFQ